MFVLTEWSSSGSLYFSAASNATDKKIQQLLVIYATQGVNGVFAGAPTGVNYQHRVELEYASHSVYLVYLELYHNHTVSHLLTFTKIWRRRKEG